MVAALLPTNDALNLRLPASHSCTFIIVPSSGPLDFKWTLREASCSNSEAAEMSQSFEAYTGLPHFFIAL